MPVPVLLGALASALLNAPMALPDAAAGRVVYDRHCASCHQVDGSGVPFTQPELIRSPKLNGDKDVTLDMIFRGSQAIPIGTSDYAGEMPGFDGLSDTEIAEVATYVRTHFENSGSVVTVDDVVRARGKFLGK